MRVALQLHPDWPTRDGRRVLESLVEDGRYRSQFETGTSNGGLTAHPGGDRWRWESRLFSGRYDAAAPGERPAYGAVDRGTPHGPAPRFGSAYLRLRDDVAGRCTFCFPDSVFEPEDHGGPDSLPRLLGLLDAGTHEALADPLNAYVEAHVHGGVGADDVEAVVLDPCFRGGPVEEAASAVAVVEWHPGFRLEAADVDDDYRGPEVADLARSLGTALTPAVIGDAARAGRHDPQLLKRVWHHLARSVLSG